MLVIETNSERLSAFASHLTALATVRGRSLLAARPINREELSRPAPAMKSSVTRRNIWLRRSGDPFFVAASSAAINSEGAVAFIAGANPLVETCCFESWISRRGS
jgi:hypothetical protein